MEHYGYIKEAAEIISENETHPFKYLEQWQNDDGNNVGYLFPIDEEHFSTIEIEEERNSDYRSIKINTEPIQELNEIEQNDHLPDTQQRPFRSDGCPKEFINKSFSIKMVRNHSGKKNFECDECHKRFAHQYTVNRHKKIHAGERPHQCDQCPMRFRQKHDLKRHKFIHTGERKFECDECPMNFVLKAHLVGHKRIHTRELLYQCGKF